MIDTYAKPEPDDFLFVLENASGERFDAFIEISSISGFSSKELDCRYKKVGSGTDKWTFLHGMTIDEHHVNTGEKVDAILEKFVDELNEAIKKVFGAQASVTPVSGFERLDWLIKNKLTEKDNIVSIKNGNK